MWSALVFNQPVVYWFKVVAVGFGGTCKGCSVQLKVTLLFLVCNLRGVLSKFWPCVCALCRAVVCCVGRVRLEAFSDNSGKLQLSLQEIIEWLTAKDEELSEQLPIGGDVGAVQHQREFHQVWYTNTQHTQFVILLLFFSYWPFFYPLNPIPALQNTDTNSFSIFCRNCICH